ncbi:MAG: hypothetical protein AAGH43_03675 [Pseudomonadota bacterium]
MDRRTKSIPVLAVALVGTVLALPSTAQELDTDRFHVVDTADGVLRIDRETGHISECQRETSGWVCRLVADDRQAYEAEINRLDSEVERLEGDLSDALAALDIQGGEQLTREDAARRALELPSEEELDAVMDTAEEVMSRFFGMVERLRDDIEQERAEP